MIMQTKQRVKRKNKEVSIKTRVRKIKKRRRNTTSLAVKLQVAIGGMSMMDAGIDMLVRERRMVSWIATTCSCEPLFLRDCFGRHPGEFDVRPSPLARHA